MASRKKISFTFSSYHGPFSPFAFASRISSAQRSSSCWAFFVSFFTAFFISLLINASGSTCFSFFLVNILAKALNPFVITAARKAHRSRISWYSCRSFCLSSSFRIAISSLGLNCRISSSVQPNSLANNTTTSAVSHSELTSTSAESAS